jgi:hypothetical protein
MLVVMLVTPAVTLVVRLVTVGLGAFWLVNT